MIGGAGLATFGGRNWADAKRVPQMQQANQDVASSRHAVNAGRKARAREELRHQEAMQRSRGKVRRRIYSGRARRAAGNLEQASRDFDRSKSILENNKAAMDPARLEH